MFTAKFGQQLIQAAHPLIVVQDENVLGSFSTLEDAEEFIARHCSYSALALRHNGEKWVMAEERLARALLQNAKSGFGPEDGVQRPKPHDVTLVARIQEMLRRFPHVTYHASARHLEIPAQTRCGFKVWIQQHSRSYVVGFERWREQFANVDAAQNCFLFGLSRACRLRVLSCGGVDYKWQVQRQFEGRWITASEIGMVLIPFWCKRSERVLQNNIIDAS